MVSVWRNTQPGGMIYGPSDHSAGPVFRRAAVRTAVPQPCRRDAQRYAFGRRPDARQAASGGRAVRLGEHGGRRLSDAGGGRISGVPGAQRLLCTGVSGPALPPGRSAPAACAAGAAPRAAGAVRPFHPGRGPGAVPLPHMGAAAEGAAVLFAGAAHPRRCAGRPGPAAGTGRISFRIPGRAVRAAPDRGGSRSGIPAEPAGPAAAGHGRSGNAGLSPCKTGAGKQRRALLLPAGGWRWSLGGGVEPVGCGGVLRHAQPPVPHRRHHAGGPQSRASALGSPQAGRPVHHRGRLRLRVPL